MTNEEKEFIKKINIDKANKKTNGAILLIVLSLLTYILPSIFKEFDFGIIFETIALFFVIIAKIYMIKYDEIRAKRYIICSMLSIGWLLVYDIVFICSSIKDIADLLEASYLFLWGEILLIFYLVILFAIKMNLSKADNPERYKESTDWFYEKCNKKY